MDRSVEPEEEQTACDAAHTTSFTTDMPPCLLLIAVVKEKNINRRHLTHLTKKRGVTSQLLEVLCSAADSGQHKAAWVAFGVYSLKDVLEHVTLPLLTKHLWVRHW